METRTRGRELFDRAKVTGHLCGREKPRLQVCGAQRSATQPSRKLIQWSVCFGNTSSQFIPVSEGRRVGGGVWMSFLSLM